MKRWLFISGIVIIVVLLGIWAYLLLTPNSSPRDLFNSFGLSGEEEFETPEQTPPLPELETELDALRQLTARRVAGYHEVVTASSSPKVYIIEAGTGHIFSIDPATGNEVRISNITIRNTVAGSVSPSGDTAAVIARVGRSQSLTLVDLVTLEESVHDEPVLQASFSSKGDRIFYTTTVGSRVLAKALDVETKVTSNLFSLPFNEATVVWGSEEVGPHYFYPKTARLLEGYLYRASSSVISREPVSGFGLSTLTQDTITFFSKATDQEYTSHYLNTSSGEIEAVSATFFPEKCAFTSQNNLICGKPPLPFGPEFPDEWYRGEVAFSDSLWIINTNTNQTSNLVNTLSTAGREIDSFNLSVGVNDASVYFMNKNDSSLWVYDL